MKKQIEVYNVLFSNIEYGTFFNRSVAHEMSSIPEDEPVEYKTRQFGKIYNSQITIVLYLGI